MEDCQSGQAVSNTGEVRATKDYKDLGNPAGRSLYGHYPPPSALCTQSANGQGGGGRKKKINQALVKNSLIQLNSSIKMSIYLL